MFNIRIERVLNKPIADVFDAFADHANYARFRGIKASRLVEDGESEKNGQGALRFLDLGSVQFEERITQFMWPTRLGYLIEKSSPLPFKHEIGEISLTEDGDKTHVVWVSRGRITVPLLGRFYFDGMFERQGVKGFTSLLKQIEAL